MFVSDLVRQTPSLFWRTSIFRRLKETADTMLRYPLPVQANIDFFNELTPRKTMVSSLARERPDIISLLDSIACGSFVITPEGETSFTPQGTRKRLPARAGSSSMRALALLNYYLRHEAKPGQFLLIDEPELNLHPTNQRLMSRLLAQICNYGIKVLITTHSDYIVRELSTLRMAHVLNMKGLLSEQRLSELGIVKEAFLDPESSTLFTLTQRQPKRGKSKHVEIEEVESLGQALWNPRTFDDSINEMNHQQAMLYSLLVDSEQTRGERP